MKEELLKNVNNIFTVLINSLQSGIDVSKQEIPLLLKEIIQYNLILSSFVSAILFIICVISIYITVRVVSYFRSDAYHGRDPELLLIPVGFSIISFIIGCCHFTKALQCYFAPRLFLLEYIKEFIK